MPRDRIHYGSISTQEEPHDVYCDCGGYAEHVENEQEDSMQTYEIIKDGQAIKCLRCGLTSWHPFDVDKRYCGKCGYHPVVFEPVTVDIKEEDHGNASR